MSRPHKPSLDQALLAAARQRPGASAGELASLLGVDVPRQTLTRYLGRLTAAGELLAVGQSKGRRYFPADLSAYLMQPAALRPAVRFLPERVESGLPRFSPAQLARLHAAGAPVAGGSTVEALAQAVREPLLVELSWASSVLEGNTYSMLETQALIAYGQEAQGKAALETQMILNHRDAVRYLLDHAAILALDYPCVRDFHALLSNNLLGNPADSGRIRQRAVFIGQSSYAPLDNDYQLREALDQLLATVAAEADPFNRSLMLLVGIAYVQPFVDCNKRTGRVLANLPLLQARCPPLSFVTLDKLGYLQGLLAYYELGLTAPIAACYFDAYLQSAAHYGQRMGSVMRDPARMQLETRYRGFLREWLRAVVMGERSATEPLPEEIPADDQVALAALVKEHLDSLHEGRAVVLGLKPEQLRDYLGRR